MGVLFNNKDTCKTICWAVFGQFIVHSCVQLFWLNRNEYFKIVLIRNQNEIEHIPLVDMKLFQDARCRIISTHWGSQFYQYTFSIFKCVMDEYVIAGHFRWDHGRDNFNGTTQVMSLSQRRILCKRYGGVLIWLTLNMAWLT